MNLDSAHNSNKEPWVILRPLIDLENRAQDDPQVILAHQQTLQDPFIISLIDELQAWPGLVLSSHKSASQHYHKLSFLADIGLTKEDPGIQSILDKVMSHRSAESLFTLPINIPPHFGGTGETVWGWALCDAPILLYCLAKMGYKDHPWVLEGKAFLCACVKENGWPCQVCPALGKFRGPGRKEDPCPYVNLIMLKLLAQYPDELDRKESRIGCENLLHLWETSLEKHPYMFYMGKDFRKLKVPLIWYDLLHVVDTLSNYPFVIKDPRFIEMVELIHSKKESNLYTPESEWQVWKDQSFASKKQGSLWMTFLIERIDKRINR
jgi:hypothetical protein